MRVEEKKQGNVAIIALEGNMVGTGEADVLHREVQSLLEKDTTQIVLDMKEVHWMGSLCIGAVMREIISVRKRKGDIHLATPSNKVSRLFQITQLERIVNIYPTVDEAVKGFTKD
jgi:anti-sigma B factor antagonist